MEVTIETELSYLDIGNHPKTLADYREDANEAYDRIEKILDSLTFDRQKALKKYLGVDTVLSDDDMGEYNPTSISDIAAIFKYSEQKIRNLLNNAVDDLKKRETFLDLNRAVQNFRNAHTNASELILMDSLRLDELGHADATY